MTNLQLTLCVGPQRDHRCLVWLTSVHDSSQEDENVKSQRRRTPSDGTTLSDELWKLYSPGCMVGALMSVGVMTVGVMSVGEITVGVMTVGVMRRPQISAQWSLKTEIINFKMS